MLLNNNLKQEIRQHALSRSEEEVCGFICFNLFSHIKEIYRCNNSISNRANSFSISPLDYVRASRSGEILAVYHSHINNNVEFSLSDKINSNNHEIPFILYNVKQNIFNEYIPNNYDNTYVGREFKYGKSDCLSLVKEYYKKELNIDIIDKFLNRTEKWFEENSSAFLEGWKRDNPKFRVVDKPQKHDVLLFNYYKMIKAPHHVGVYLGNDIFLHHPRHKYSLIEYYSNSFKKRTIYTLRYDQG